MPTVDGNMSRLLETIGRVCAHGSSRFLRRFELFEHLGLALATINSGATSIQGRRRRGGSRRRPIQGLIPERRRGFGMGKHCGSRGGEGIGELGHDQGGKERQQGRKFLREGIAMEGMVSTLKEGNWGGKKLDVKLRRGRL